MATINVETENEVARMKYRFHFDPVRLRIVDVRQGDFISRTGAKSEMTFTADESRGSLSIELAEDRDGPSISGGGIVAVVRFEALSAGRADLSLSDASMADLNNDRVGSVLPPPYTVTIEK